MTNGFADALEVYVEFQFLIGKLVTLDLAHFDERGNGGFNSS